MHMMTIIESLAPVMASRIFYSYPVHVCIEKSGPGKLISSLVSYQELISSHLKYFTPQDNYTVSLQISTKFMPGPELYIIYA